MITNIDDSEKPYFSEVVDIFTTETSAVFLGLRELQVVEFHTHFHSWAVKKTDCYSLKLFRDLDSTQVIPVRPARFDADALITVCYNEVFTIGHHRMYLHYKHYKLWT